VRVRWVPALGGILRERGAAERQALCVVSVIALLVSVGSLAGALLEWTDPLHAGELQGYPPRSLASFETYKMDVLNPPYGGPQTEAPRYVPDDETLRRKFEAARLDRIQSITARIRRTVLTPGVAQSTHPLHDRF
jgi:hypothetical protein